MAAKPRVLFLVENLPVPTDRRVWHEALTLRDAGFEVSVVAPQWHFPRRFEQLQGINIYRFPMPSMGGIGGSKNHGHEHVCSSLFSS